MWIFNVKNSLYHSGCFLFILIVLYCPIILICKNAVLRRFFIPPLSYSHPIRPTQSVAFLKGV